MTKDELYGLIDAALEGANITQEDYRAVRRDLKLNALDEAQATKVLQWLEAQEAWPEAMLSYPDMILEELREQNEIDSKPQYNNSVKGMAMFSTKGVFHSALVKAGPVRMQITSDVLKSKFGKEDYVIFELEGGETHTYAIENDGIRATLENLPKNQWLTVHASGSRDTAAIQVDEAPTQGQIAGARAASVAAKAAPHIQPAKSMSELMKECLRAAHDLEVWYDKEFGGAMTENARALAISFAIEGSRSPGKAIAA